jgi:hypothetical protein
MAKEKQMMRLAEEKLSKPEAIDRHGPQLTTKYTSRGNDSSEDNIDSSEEDCNDSNLSNFYSNDALSIDGIIMTIWKLTFIQSLSVLLNRTTLIINVFFISLAGYYSIETFETTQAIIKGIGLSSIIVNVFFFGLSVGLNGALETLVSFSFGCSENEKETELYRIELRQQCGNYLNIARFINTIVFMFPSIFLVVFAHEILITFFK